LLYALTTVAGSFTLAKYSIKPSHAAICRAVRYPSMDLDRYALVKNPSKTNLAA
jgi:hypothetical protein